MQAAGTNTEMSTRLAYELGSIPAAQMTAQIDALNELEVTIGDKVYKGVRLVRCFPLTHLDKFVVLLQPNGEEIGVIEDLQECKPEVRNLLLDLLNTTYLVPQITRINSITTRGYVPVWDVETDRGHRVLELHSRRETYAIGTRVVIRDADGNRYEIEDYTKLDRHSQRLVEREI